MSPFTDVADMAEMERAAAQGDMVMLTSERYSEMRNDFIDAMTGVLAEREKQSGSYIYRGKNLVGGLGALLGLTGTIASAAVSNDDTKQSLAQTSALVASVSAIVALVPFGNPPKGAVATQRYLEVELPLFQSRWPASLDAPLDAGAWELFLADIRRTQTLLMKFSQ